MTTKPPSPHHPHNPQSLPFNQPLNPLFFESLPHPQPLPRHLDQPIKHHSLQPISTPPSLKPQLYLDPYQIQQSKLQSIIMSSQLRRINHKIALEEQCINTKRKVIKLQSEVKQKQNQLKNKKRQLIKQRLKQIQRNKKQRVIAFKKTNRAVARIKQIQQHKQLLIQQTLKNNLEQYKKCYDKKLQQRKKLLIPMNFLQINTHANKIKKYNYQNPTPRQKILARINTTQDPQEQSIKINIFPSTKNYHLKNYYSQRHHKNPTNPLPKSSIDTTKLFSTRDSSKVLKLTKNRQKSQQYGDMVQKQYHNNRAKTQSIQISKIKQQQAQQLYQQQHQQLKKIKKPNLPFDIDLEQAKHNQIKKIKNSTLLSPQQKLIKLNQLYQIQLNKLNTYKKSNDLKYLNYLNLINMVRAEILLTLS